MKIDFGLKCECVIAVFAMVAAVVSADETISANVTLSADADWRDKGLVTINEGVTVNLNGHKLTLAGITGAGTIESPLVDLTSPSGSASSTTIFLGGNAGNLFNNNFERAGTDNTKRIIVEQKNLPLVVDYDFGAGNEQAVNMYKVYCGPISGFTTRCPKSWTFEGSNDNTNWTLLDARDTETGWGTTECRTKTFENTTAYRYYRFTVTAPQDSNSGYLEMVQLEYFDTSSCGEIRLDIPPEVTVENEGVAIDGNIKLVKDGTGTFVAAKDGQTYSCGTHIVSGTFKGGATYNATAYAGTGPIIVESGATLDINGNLYFYPNAITLAGGTVANTGTSPTINQTQLVYIKLTADSYFNARSSLGMINSGHGITTIDLGGHTLFVSIGNGAVFRIDNTDIVNGTLKVVENLGIISFVQRETRSQSAILDFTGDLRCYADSQIGDMILREGVFSMPGAENWFRVFGKFTPLTDDFGNTEMQDGSTLDLSARTGVMNIVNQANAYTLAIASNATVTVNLAGRTLALGEKLLRWRESQRPDEVTFQFDAETAQSGIQPVVTDTGLFYGVDPDSTLAEYAWWTGAANDGNPENPGNWTCKNVAGNTIENGLPGEITTVKVTGPLDLQVPVGSTVTCEVFDVNVCQLTADCDWRGIDKLTLDAESKLDLNGHKLYVNGLYGSGEITGGEFDLTTDNPYCVSSTSAITGGNAANLFNNNFTRNHTDNNRRILVKTSDLPLVVDYNFGAATYIDSYALYVGPHDDYLNAKRTPKAWKIYGSNDGVAWTELDARTVPAIGKNALCRRFGIANPDAYCRYRFESTAAQEGNDGYFEMVQLEYGDSRTTSELHVTAPEGETLRNASVLLSGNMKLVKEGSGTFIATMANQTYSGGTEVVGGTLQDGTYGFNAPLGNAGAITVGPDGRFNMANGAFFGYPFVLAGGVVSSGADFTGIARTIPTLTLTADSLLDATHTFGLVGNTGDTENVPCTLDLGGHTLDVVIGENKAFRLKNAYAYNGTIRVTECAEGGIFSFIDTGVRAETVDFELIGEVRAHCPVTVHNLTLKEGACTGDHAPQGTIAVLGTFKTETTDIPNVELRDGATFDLREQSGPFPAAGTSEYDAGLSFADGATVKIDLRGRRCMNDEYVLTWEEPPENLATLKFKACEGSTLTFYTDAGGVRVFSGLIISIR